LIIGGVGEDVGGKSGGKGKGCNGESGGSRSEGMKRNGGIGGFHALRISVSDGVSIIGVGGKVGILPSVCLDPVGSVRIGGVGE